MGDRAQVKFIDDKGRAVWFYTHSAGSRLEETVAQAMKRGKGRHNDSEYLARIIFSEMIKYNVMSELGYGIGFEQHGDVSRVVTVNCQHQQVTMFDGRTWPFKAFV